MERIAAERRSPFGASPDVGERGRRTQQRLLAAAVEVFAEVGYHRARVEQITERAQCSRPTFYQYFASKHELFDRLAGRLGQSLAELTEDLSPIGADAGGLGVLRGWLVELATLHAQRAPVFDAFRPAMGERAGLVVDADVLTQRYGKALARATMADVDADDPELVAALVLTTVFRTLSFARWADLDSEVVVDRLTELVHRSLFGPIRGVNVPAVPAGAVPAGSVPPTSVPAHSVRPPPDPDDDIGGARSRLVEAAREVFAGRAYDGVRVDDVVARAGVAHGTFYRYFAGKEEVFLEVAGAAADEMVAMVDRFPRDRREVRAWSERWFTTYDTHGAIFSAWAEASPALADPAWDVATSVTRRLAGVLGADGPAGEVDVLALLGLLEWSPYLARAYPSISMAAASEAMATIVERAFLTPAQEDP